MLDLRRSKQDDLDALPPRGPRGGVRPAARLAAGLLLSARDGGVELEVGGRCVVTAPAALEGVNLEAARGGQRGL
jgi:hypothetical protein